MSAAAYAWLFFPICPMAALVGRDSLFHRVRRPPSATSGHVRAPLPHDRVLDVYASISGCLRGIFRDNDARQGWPAEAKARANRILSSPLVADRRNAKFNHFR